MVLGCFLQLFDQASVSGSALGPWGTVNSIHKYILIHGICILPGSTDEKHINTIVLESDNCSEKK